MRTQYRTKSHELPLAVVVIGANVRTNRVPWVLVVAFVYPHILTVLAQLGFIDQRLSGLAGGAVVVGVFALFAREMFTRRALVVGWQSDWIGWGFLGLAAATAVSTALAAVGNRLDPAAMWRQYAMAFVVVPLYFLIREKSRDRRAYAAILLGLDVVTVMAIGSLVLDITGIYVGERFGDRRFGILGDSVAWLLSAMAVVQLARSRWAVSAICIVCLLLTASRAPILITVAAILTYATLTPIKSTEAYIKKIIAFAAIFLAVVGASYLLPNVADRFKTTDIAVNDRFMTTLLTFEVFRSSPIIGSGYNAHTDYFAQYFGTGREGLGIHAVPVSTPAQSLADSGAIGFGFLMTAFITLILASLRVIRRKISPAGIDPLTYKFSMAARGLACWLLAFMVLNQTSGYLLPSSALGAFFFCAAGIIAGCAQWSFIPVASRVRPARTVGRGRGRQFRSAPPASFPR